MSRGACVESGTARRPGEGRRADGGDGMQTGDLARMIAQGRGLEPADLVVKGARLHW